MHCVHLTPPPSSRKRGGGGSREDFLRYHLFHQHWLKVWYEGGVVERNGDEIPGAILSFMGENMVYLSVGPLFAKLAFLRMVHILSCSQFVCKNV